MRKPWPSLVPLLGALLAAAIAGCGGGAKPTQPAGPRPTSTAQVDVQGAILEAEDGARVEIPASASLYAFEATISRSSEGAPPLPTGLVPAGALYSLQPHGAVFTMPIRVSLPFDPGAVPAGATVKVARGEPGGRWEILAGAVEGNRISVATSGFSFYMPTVIHAATYVFPALEPFGEVTVAGQTPVTAQSPPAFFPDGAPNPFIPVLNYRIYTQAQLATPLAVTLRGAVPAGSQLDLYCGPRELRLVVTAYTARVYPDPANASRTLVRTNRMVRWGDGFDLADPVELARVVVPRDGLTRSHPFSLNLAHYAYRLGPDDYPTDPWTGGPATFNRTYGGPSPLPPTGAPGLTLATHYSCSDNSWFMEYDRSPQTALRRGFTENVVFTSLPSDLTVVEGEPVAFRAMLPASGGPGTPRLLVAKWQRAFASEPDLWFDLDPFAVSPADMGGWETYNDTGFATTLFIPDGQGLLTRPSVTRAEHNGQRLRAVACEVLDLLARACISSPPATLTVTQDFVVPQALTNPAPQVTVRENASGQVTQWSATFSGRPQPTVRWETRAPGSQLWEPVDPATHVRNGATLSTTRAFPLSERGREYRAVATNAGGSTTSFSSVLFVTTGLEAPAITAQPQDAAVASGSPVLFAAAVTGAAPMSYQWYFNGSPILGANGTLLALNGVNAGNAGSYELEASNRENRVRSRAARLSVFQASAPPPSVSAPRILTQPAPVVVTAGNTATFAVGAQGSEPLGFQWYQDDRPIDGATAAAFTIRSVQESDAGIYSVVVTSAGGKARSDAVALTVLPASGGSPVPPAITTQPTGLAVLVGQGATLAVAASGTAPISYAWRRNGVPIPGASGPILSFASAAIGDAGQYSVVVSNVAGAVASADAGLVVTAPPGAPTITAQPSSRSVLVGEAATFAIDVAGAPAPTCLWLRNGTAVSAAGPCGAFTVAAATLADDGAVFTVLVHNAGGIVLSAPAILTVTDLLPPVITAQPADVEATEGGSVAFTVAATANGPLTYAWERLGGATQVTDTGSLALAGVTLADSGAQFRARVCNGPQADGRCTNSRIATLTVAPPVPAGALTATQVAAGFEWSLALRPDRTVWGWGGPHRTDGTVQTAGLLPSERAMRPVQLYPVVLTDVHEVAGWSDGFWALRGEPGSAASRVLHWGIARSGSDGRGSDGAGNLGPIPQTRSNPAPVELLERRTVNGALQAVPVDRVCSIAATSDRVLMIRALDALGLPTDCAAGSAKTVWVAGTLTPFSSDALGVVVPVLGLPSGVPARLVAAQHTAQSSSGPILVLLEDGRLFGWGTNIGNQLGLPVPASTGYVGSNSAPQELPSSWGVARDAAFSYVGLIVQRADGSAAVSGRNDGGELGLGPQPSGTVNDGPLPLLAGAGVALDGVQALASTQARVSLALRQGRILAWGAPNQPLQGGSVAQVDYPRLLPASGDGWRALSAGHLHALVIASNGTVYTWGDGTRGALGDGMDGGKVAAPTLVMVP